MTPADSAHSRRRHRPRMSFRAPWEPVATPDYGLVGEPHRPVATLVRHESTSSLATTGAAAVAVLPAPAIPAIPAIDVGGVARPVVDAAIAVGQHVHAPAWTQRLLHRALDVLPFAAALVLITSLVWGAIWLPIPLVIMLLAFDIYWAWRSFNNGIHAYRGYHAMRAHADIDWRRKYEAESFGPRQASGEVLAWDDVHHLVIIPTYKESVDKLRATLAKLAESEMSRQKLLVVIAMEQADDGAPQRFDVLSREFAHSVGSSRVDLQACKLEYSIVSPK